MKKRVLIKDYLFFQEGPGVRNNQYTNSGVKLLNVANLVDGKIDLSKSSRYISEEDAYKKYKHFLVDDGDLIIASSGIQVDYFDKKMGFARKEHLPLCMNTSTIRFKSLDESIVNINYFMYFLKSKDFKNQLFRQITGSAQLNFGPFHLKQMTFSLIKLEEQKNIVKELDKINEALDNRKSMIEDLEEYLKLRFYKLLKENNVKNVALSKLCIGQPEYGSGGAAIVRKDFDYRYVRITDINDNGNLNDKAVTLENADKYLNYQLKEDDIVFARTGATVGKTYLYNKRDGKCIFAGYLIKFEIDRNKLNPYYLKQFTNSDIYWNWIKISAKVGAQPNINAKQYGLLEIPIVDLDIQNNFEKTFLEVEKEKELVQQDIKDLESLLETKMHEYFD